MTNEDKYKELVTYLDCALTGHTYSECLHTFNCVPHTIEEFLLGNLYYLTDGGYSRLHWHLFHEEGVGGLHLSSESRDEVKEALKRCKELIADLNDFLLEMEKELEL
jgi:hypothetical protein